MIQAFRVFDLLDTGKLSADKFKEVLTTLGEAVSDDDLDAILKEAVMDEGGNFDYTELAKILCAGPKGIRNHSYSPLRLQRTRHLRVSSSNRN